MGLESSDLLRCVNCELAGDLVEFIDDVLHAVVGLGDDGARKGVGLADVRAALEVTPMDLADRVGLREHEEVVVALQLLR